MTNDTTLNASAQAAQAPQVEAAPSRMRVIREVVRGSETGMKFIILNRGDKNSGSFEGTGWQNRRHTLEYLTAQLMFEDRNIGLLLGEPSNGLVDVDLDCPEAVTLAPMFLPDTRRFGRVSNPNSHYLFKLVGAAGATRKFQRDGETFVELRSTGCQTIYPGSLNPEDGGELVDWVGTGNEEITEIAYDDLLRSVRKIAAASLLVRHYPTSGRHDAMLALAGGLMRAGWVGEELKQFLAAIGKAASDEELRNRLDGIPSTAKRLEEGATAKGFPSLAEFIGEDVVRDVRTWLAIGDDRKKTRISNDGESIGRKAKELVRIAEGTELFSVPGEKMNTGTFATVPKGGHFETYRIASEEFRAWLMHEFRIKTGGDMVSRNTLQSAIDALQAEAFHGEKKYQTFVRIGEADGKLYYDLGDAGWRVVEISAEGWRILDKSPVKFIRPGGYSEQVAPVWGGSFDDLRGFINTEDARDWTLLVGWIISSFGYRPQGAYALLSLAGTQDAAKSTTTKMLRMLIDPSSSLVRSQPKEERDLMVGAKNNWILAFDNLSHVPEWLSDAFCRLATGGGQANRQNYTDGDEYLFDARRPVIMNGISELATRPDLVDRTINVWLPSLKDSQRKDEATLYGEYKEALPRILGAVFTTLVSALRNLPEVKLDRLPRMADVAKFVTAAEPAMGWKPGTFLTTFEDYRRAAKVEALEGDSFGWAVYQFLTEDAGRKLMLNTCGKAEWIGTAQQLLNGANGHAEGFDKNHFPKSPKGVSNAVMRLVPNFKEVGISIELPKRAERVNGEVGRYIKATIIKAAVLDNRDVDVAAA